MIITKREIKKFQAKSKNNHTRIIPKVKITNQSRFYWLKISIEKFTQPLGLSLDLKILETMVTVNLTMQMYRSLLKQTSKLLNKYLNKVNIAMKISQFYLQKCKMKENMATNSTKIQTFKLNSCKVTRLTLIFRLAVKLKQSIEAFHKTFALSLNVKGQIATTLRVEL